jgi:hypothetical protein
MMKINKKKQKSVDVKNAANNENEDFGKILKNAFRDLQENSLSVSKSLEGLIHLEYFAGKFNMSLDRAAIFATIHCLSFSEIKLSERNISSFLKPFFQSNSKLVRTQLREMLRTNLLEKERNDGVHVYAIESAIAEAIDNNDLDTIKNIGPIGLDASLEYFNRKLLSHDTLSKAELGQYLDDIFENNATLNLIKYCERHCFVDTVFDAYVCLAICVKAVFENEPFRFSYLDIHFSSGKNYIHYMRREIITENWAPIAEGLVENAGGEMLDFNPELKLTPKGFDYFLKELDPEMLHFLRTRLGKVKLPLIQPKDIQKVDLYFNTEFATRLNRMENILMPQKFAQFQATFPQNAKMKGLTILFHGGPGCGKTEMVLQLCRKTKRPLMKIEVTDFQSKWVGESEQKLKQVFEDYKTAYERMEVAPILFLNECDQIIGKRVGIRNSVDQMSNALQNILLEQMEQFNGIMIGTTNLTKNMDGAFERRWLMKFEFEAPNDIAKISIWKSAIKGLRRQEALALVQQFGFTPAEINNVARRFMVENLLGLQKTRLETLIELCKTEHYQNMAQSNIGFTLEKSLSLKSKVI